jgi:hypothetical protein
VLLKCVHPLQWPYDELLLALALSQKSIKENEKDSGAIRGISHKYKYIRIFIYNMCIYTHIYIYTYRRIDA